MNEKWLSVPTWEGLYEVSDQGNVRSLERTVFATDRWGNQTKRTIKAKARKPAPYLNGYLGVQLTTQNRREGCLVHRLVLSAFAPIEGFSDLQVNHKNGVRSDNRLTNLEWMTCSDNHKHSYRELPRKAHMWATPCVLFKDGAELSFPTLGDAARHLSVHPASVSSAYRNSHRVRGWEVRV